MDFTTKTAYWLVGADKYIINRGDMAEKDKKALILTGWMIALATIVSTVVATFFVTMLFENQALKIGFGILTALFWSSLVLRIDRSLFADKAFGSLIIRLFYALLTAAIISIPIKMAITDGQIEDYIQEQTSLYNQQLKAENYTGIDTVYQKKIDVIQERLVDATRYSNEAYIAELRLQKTELKQDWEAEKTSITTEFKDRLREPNYSLGNKFMAFLEIQQGKDWMNWLLILGIFLFESSPCWLRLVYHNCTYLKIVDAKQKQIIEVQELKDNRLSDISMPLELKNLYRNFYDELIKNIKTDGENDEILEQYKQVISQIESGTYQTKKQSKQSKQDSNKSSKNGVPEFDYQN